MTQRSFRILLVMHLVSLLLGGVLGHAFPQLLSADLAEAYAATEAESVLGQPWAWAVVAPLGIAGLAGYVGLFMLRRWGRTLSLATTALGLCLYPFFGPTVATWPQSALTDLSNILWGAALALAYLGPVSAQFVANKSLKPNPLRGSA